MNKFDWSSFFPEKQNNYGGSRIALVFLIVWASVGIIRGSIHIFAPDGGAGSIAGFDLSKAGAAELLFYLCGPGHKPACVYRLAVDRDFPLSCLYSTRLGLDFV